MPAAAAIIGSRRCRQVDSSPVDELALDLKSDEQEEDRHQPVIDPQMNGHRAELRRQHRPGFGVQCMMISLGQAAIGGDQGQRCGRHQQQPPAASLARKWRSTEVLTKG